MVPVCIIQPFFLYSFSGSWFLPIPDPGVKIKAPDPGSATPVTPRGQCCGSMTFWGGSGSGSADPCLWLMDPDPDSDPYLWLMDPYPDPGGQKTCGSGSGSTTMATPRGYGTCTCLCHPAPLLSQRCPSLAPPHLVVERCLRQRGRAEAAPPSPPNSRYPQIWIVNIHFF